MKAEKTRQESGKAKRAETTSKQQKRKKRSSNADTTEMVRQESRHK